MAMEKRGVVQEGITPDVEGVLDEKKGKCGSGCCCSREKSAEDTAAKLDNDVMRRLSDAAERKPAK